MHTSVSSCAIWYRIINNVCIIQGGAIEFSAPIQVNSLFMTSVYCGNVSLTKFKHARGIIYTYIGESTNQSNTGFIVHNDYSDSLILVLRNGFTNIEYNLQIILME